MDKPVDPEDLIEALRRRLAGAERHSQLALAHPRTTNERAWALIGLGVALRYSGDYLSALAALDAAVALKPEARAKRAAYDCAVAIHRDRGDEEAARRVRWSTPE